MLAARPPRRAPQPCLQARLCVRIGQEAPRTRRHAPTSPHLSKDLRHCLAVLVRARHLSRISSHIRPVDGCLLRWPDRALVPLVACPECQPPQCHGRPRPHRRHPLSLPVPRIAHGHVGRGPPVAARPSCGQDQDPPAFNPRRRLHGAASRSARLFGPPAFDGRQRGFDARWPGQPSSRAGGMRKGRAGLHHAVGDA